MLLVLVVSFFVGQAGQPVDAGLPAAVDTCAQAQKQLARVVLQIEQRKGDARRLEDQASRNCQQLLRTHGDGEFARCMAGRSEAVAPDQLAQQQLETSRETLRRAQLNGCR